MPLTVLPADSFATGKVPLACSMCEKGSKMVLFATGVCHYQCFYCPVSAERRMARDAWVNEKRIRADDFAAIEAEARAMRATGTGITGGDPMLAPERTLEYVRFLKKTFGARHHIHLYTQVPFAESYVRDLDEAGLDELRFHPHPDFWSRMAEDYHDPLIRAALQTDMTVSIEVPCLPDRERDLAALIDYACGVGVHNVNVNELEFSPTNARALRGHGYEYRDDVSNVVAGSRDVAWRLAKRFEGKKTKVHFCSSPFKDAVQLRNRLRRRSKTVAKPYHVKTDDGTLIHGVIVSREPSAVGRRLAEEFDVPERLLHVGADRVLVAPWVLEELASRFEEPCYLSEVYPVDAEMEVERTPLNEAGKGAPAAPAPDAVHIP
ncbi:MAG: radical SAM protein [Methanobacteriota archaeon]